MSDKAHYVTDLDKILFTTGLLEEGSSSWYESIHYLVNKELAKLEGKQGYPESPYMKWAYFRKSLKDSFGGSMTLERVVEE